MQKNVTTIFTLSFTINLIWEFAHSFLYANFKGQSITFPILLGAAICDAVIILVLISIANQLKLNKLLFITSGGVIIAIIIELWALHTQQWAYNSFMPIIPIVKTGLTPTVQLAITGYVVQKLIPKKLEL